MEDLSLHPQGFSPELIALMKIFMKAFKLTNPEVIPAEPITKPAPVKEPNPIIKPDENPWVFPLPSVEPTPKAFKVRMPIIEYDGEQHYKPIPHYGGEEGFDLRQKRDYIKTKFCQDNNIQLVRIRFDENILDKLKFL